MPHLLFNKDQHKLANNEHQTLKARLSEQLTCILFAAEHIESLHDLEHPHSARRLVRRLRRCSTLVHDVVHDSSSTVKQIDAADLEACRSLESCSRFLVRDGVRRALTRDRFCDISRSAVLLGELSKACLGAYLGDLRLEVGKDRAVEFDLNPIHVFVPVMADGYVWASRSITIDNSTAETLCQHLDSTAERFCRARISTPSMVKPLTQITAEALHLSWCSWQASEVDRLISDAHDRSQSGAIAALDGARIPQSTLEHSFELGVAAFFLRSALDRVGCAQLDSANALELLVALQSDSRNSSLPTHEPKSTKVR